MQSFALFLLCKVQGYAKSSELGADTERLWGSNYFP
jgi:hypothetical protein